MSGRRHLAALALAAALAVPALSACQDEEPQPRLPEESPSSAEPTPTEAETTEAAEETPEELARRWQAGKDELQATGDGSAYLAVTERCGPCEDFVERVEKIYADGGRVEAGPTKVLSVTEAGQVGSLRSYDVVLLDSPTKVFDAAGSVVQEFPGGRSTLRIDIEQSGGALVIRRITRVAGG